MKNHLKKRRKNLLSELSKKVKWWHIPIAIMISIAMIYVGIDTYKETYVPKTTLEIDGKEYFWCLDFYCKNNGYQMAYQVERIREKEEYGFVRLDCVGIIDRKFMQDHIDFYEYQIYEMCNP